jgi:AraC-like DNA-binding protein
MPKTPRSATRIVPVRYEAPASYELDVKIFPLSEFRRRVSAEHLRAPQRVDFHMLLHVTRGTCMHMVDFESLPCRRGSLLVLGPGQIQRFDTKSIAWEGWMAIWRPEFLQGRATTTARGELEVFHQLADLAVYRELSGSEQAAMTEGLNRMAADARRRGNTAALQSLLPHQLQALLVRLHLIQAKSESTATAPAVLLQRFKRYRLAVEQKLHHLHRVADYAKLIGCSQKSLQRATLAVVGVSAKTFLSQRILLEAKRVLVHTGESVTVVAEKFGFDEATNFVKFFRRRAPLGDNMWFQVSVWNDCFVAGSSRA